MNLKELSRLVADRCSLSYTDAEFITRAVFGVMEEVLEEGEAVKIHEFGSFVRSIRKAKNGYNPKLQKAQTFKPYSQIRFKPSKTQRWEV